MRLLDRYIAKNVIVSTLVVLLVIIGVESFMEFVQQLNQIGVHNYGVLQAFIFVPLKLPSDIYQLFPMAGFLGCLLGLGRLASSSELVVMRASGVSIRRIGWAVIKAALLMIIIMTLLGEAIAPKLENYAIHMKYTAMHSVDPFARGGYDIWLHQHDAFIRISTVKSGVLTDVNVFQFNKQGDLKYSLTARSGKKIDGKWWLYDVNQLNISGKKVSSEKFAKKPVDLVFNAKLMTNVKKLAGIESVVDLWKNVVYRHQTGLVASLYEYSFFKRLMQPLTSIVMILLGIPFIFGSLRQSSMGGRILVGTIIGFAFYMMNLFFGPLTLVYQFPPLISAAAPTLLFLVVYLLMLRKIN